MIILALAAGSCQVIGVWFYYQSIQDEDVSKMMPLYSIAPIFVALLSWAFLGEVFSKLIYLGILLIIAGSFILSYKKGNHKITLNPLLFIVILSTLIFAFRALFIKMATLQAELWPVFFWIGLGTLIPSIVFLVIHRIRRNQLKAIEHFFIVDIISQGGYILNLLAISAGPIALVSALTQTKPLLVFIFATFVTLFKPKFIKEDLTRTLVIRKIIAIVLIIAGSLLII